MERLKLKKQLEQRMADGEQGLQEQLLAITEEPDANDSDSQSENFDKADLTDIYGIRSTEGESLIFAKFLRSRGTGVEEWMKALEETMIVSVQKKIKDAYTRSKMQVFYANQKYLSYKM